MEKNKIAEVRGISYKQNLDPYMPQVLARKLKEFPDGDQYLKKEKDMQWLTVLEQKMKVGEDLDKQDLEFLYELNGKIEGFGYQNDPRIEELRSKRDPAADAAIVFECDPSEIARAASEIREGTKAYIGPPVPGIFESVQKYGIEHVYTAFPEGKVERSKLSIGGKQKEQLMAELKKKASRLQTTRRTYLTAPTSRQRNFQKISTLSACRWLPSALPEAQLPTKSTQGQLSLVWNFVLLR